MIDPALFTNLVAWSAQVACVVALATLAAALLRVDDAHIRYQYWRAVLALCLALPLLQPRQQPGAATGAVTTVSSAVAAPAPAPLPAAGTIDWIGLAAVVIAGGIVVRLVMLAASLATLRRMRSLGVEADADVHAEAQRSLGTRAAVRYVEGLRQPVTFGVRRPVVLLPGRLREQPPEIHGAVVCHELLHVQRRDWAWVLVEEAVRTALWFHPAIWWTVERVQLAREEVVDELTVLATGRRRAYIEALMAFADDSPLAPAAAFARRRHLFHRVVLLSKEAVMSSKRIVVSCALLALVVSSGGWYAVSAFPLTTQGAGLLAEPGPLETRAVPVTAENPVPRRTNTAAPDYPAEMELAGARGTLSLRITLDDLGRVAEMRRLGFTLRATNPSLTMSFSNMREADLNAVIDKHAAAGSATEPRRIVEAMTLAGAQAVRQWRYEPPYRAPISFVVTVAVAPAGGNSAPRAPEVPEGAVRVGGDVGVPRKVRHVSPVYPPEAQAARVTGVVILEAVVGGDGRVSSAHVLRSIPLLDQAALDAVYQWEFTPTLLNGVPVPVVMTVTVNFTLQQ